MIREIFLTMGREKGYEVLPEASLLRENQDTYFVGSAVMANMHLFEPGYHVFPARYVTAQRIFSSKRLQEIGKYPLATSFEVMLSFFRFGDTDGREALSFTLEFLEKALHIKADRLVFLAPHEMNLRSDVLRLGIPADRVISWDQSLQTNLGEDRPVGYYVKVFYPYRHGIIPVASIGFMKMNDKLAVDSAFFLERLSFVRENLPSFYSSRFFYPLTYVVRSSSEFSGLSHTDKFLWANHFRSIVALLLDGAELGSKGAGHAMKKMLRQLAGTIQGKELSRELVLQLVQSAHQCLHELGYGLSHLEGTNRLAEVADLISTQLNRASKQISQECKAFRKVLQKNRSMDKTELEKWHSERGLQYEWMEAVARQIGVILPLPPKVRKHKFRNASFSFNESERIKDPILFIKESEGLRTKGAVVVNG